MSAVDTAFSAPPSYVSAPMRQPSRFGLFSVATIVANPELRFQSGVEWEPLACEPAGSVSGVCFDPGDLPPGAPLDPRSGEGLELALPFAVYGSYDCSAFSRPLAEAEARARQHLALWEETEVERVIAAGDRDAAPSLQGAADLTPAGGASLVAGVGLLEGHLGTNYGSVGVLHMPRSLVAPARSANVVFRHGQRLETELGNYVVAGAGYDLAAVGPDGAPVPDGQAWLYATSIPVVRRGEVFVLPDEDFRPQTANNDVTVFAVRVYVVGWECVTAAVLVDLEGAPA
jgi:hypothetical protein